MIEFCSKYLGEKGPAKEICERIINLLPLGDVQEPQTWLEWSYNWITPGNVHLNLLLHTILIIAGFIIGFYRAPKISYAQYLYQKQVTADPIQSLGRHLCSIIPPPIAHNSDKYGPL